MSFEQALENFKVEIAKEFGIDNGLVKIAVEPDLMAKIVYELATKSLMKFSSERMGELHIAGVQLVARRRDNF